jgi:Ca2+-binding EF-hand superfamily protein
MKIHSPSFLRVACVVSVMSLSACAVLAQGVTGGRGNRMAAELQKRFAAADVNGDGRLTRDEAKGKMPRVYEHFDEIDTTKSGSVSLADIATYARNQQAARKGGEK